MGTTKVAPLGTFFDVAVFDASTRHFRCAGSEIQPHEGLSAHQLAPCHEFIGTELVGLDRVPCFFDDARTIFFWAYAVEPMVTRHEVAAWIANDGHADFLDF